MSQGNDLEIHETDVLVVGSGIAGMFAAAEVLRTGAGVTVVSKSAMGRGNSSYYAGGGFVLPVKGMDSEEHYRRAISTGRNLNDRRMVETLAAQAGGIPKAVEAIGVPLVFMRGYGFNEGPLWRWGGDYTLGCLKKHIRTQARMHEGVVICKILADDDGVRGAVGYDARRDAFTYYRTGNILLAAGGCGGLFERSTNPFSNGGDVYALALDAGAALRDMEFIQFLPLCDIHRPLHRLIEVWGRLTNADGQDVVVKYNLPEDPIRMARDQSSIAIMKEIREGRGVDGGLILDLKGMPDEVWCNHPRGSQVIPYFMGKYKNRQAVTVCPASHYCMGGVSAKPTAETDVPGLWAAGEVVGGTNGANRQDGNALSEAMVFGPIAGRNAAGRSKANGAPDARKEAFEWVRDLRTRLKAAKKGRSGVSVQGVRNRLRRITWEGAGVVRNADGTEKALEEVRDIQTNALPRLEPRTPIDIRTGLEAQGEAMTARIILECAIRREESRGAHLREDFPDLDDDKWLANTFVRSKDEELVFETQSLGDDVNLYFESTIHDGIGE